MKKFLLLLCFVPLWSFGQDAYNPLQPFEKFIGPEWHMEDSYVVFEWGVGKLSVNVKNYFYSEGNPVEVSQGQWYYHPREKIIKGAFTAINMPVQLFEYVGEFKNGQLICELMAYSSGGELNQYREIWDFSFEDRIEWSLLQDESGSWKKVMVGLYLRK